MTPNSEQWTRLQELFHLAAATPEADRDRVLAEACPDAELRQRALDILRGSQLTRKQRKDPPPVMPATPSIGPYRLLRLLGSGGVGSVYLAERTVGGVEQRSAVKVLAPHAAGPEFVERFHREQRILGSLEHPNITRMLDAGLTAEGQPYLVMEFADGLHFDAYCDSRKLGIAARIALFCKVCSPVEYAHRNLVLHLDLKPSNILIAEGGIPKLLDFGTSKLISSEGNFTATLMATPAYASPEQLRNRPVTTASDIYSLGVVLFELLAGRRHTADTSAAVMIERAIDEREPDRLDQAATEASADLRGVTLSRLRALLAGDLATIVRKCLAPHPEDRYGSVGALSEDLGRYLAGRPVLAQRQTAIYRLSKFVRRNRGKVALALLIVLALTGTGIYSLRQQQRALEEARRAARMQTFLYRLFKVANSNVMGKPVATVKEFLEMAAQVVPTYLTDPADLRQAQLSLAESLYWNQDLEPAERLSREALASGKSVGDFAAQAEAFRNLGLIASSSGRAPEARNDIAQAFSLSQRTGVPFESRFQIVETYVFIQEDQGHSSEENLRLMASTIQEARKRKMDPEIVAEALNYYGGMLRIRGRLDEAGGAIAEALRTNDTPLTACDHALSEYGLGSIRRSQMRHAEALTLFQDVYRRMIICSGPEAPYTLNAQAYMAETMTATGHAAEALPMLEESEPMWLKKPVNETVVFSNLWILGHAYLETGRYQEAEKVLSESMRDYAKIFPASDKRTGWTQFLWAKALASQGRFAEALPLAEAAERNLNDHPSTPLARDNANQARAQVTKLRIKTAK